MSEPASLSELDRQQLVRLIESRAISELDSIRVRTALALWRDQGRAVSVGDVVVRLGLAQPETVEASLARFANLEPIPSSSSRAVERRDVAIALAMARREVREAREGRGELRLVDENEAGGRGEGPALGLVEDAPPPPSRFEHAPARPAPALAVPAVRAARDASVSSEHYRYMAMGAGGALLAVLALAGLLGLAAGVDRLGKRPERKADAVALAPPVAPPVALPTPSASPVAEPPPPSPATPPTTRPERIEVRPPSPARPTPAPGPAGAEPPRRASVDLARVRGQSRTLLADGRYEQAVLAINRAIGALEPDEDEARAQLEAMLREAVARQREHEAAEWAARKVFIADRLEARARWDRDLSEIDAVRKYLDDDHWALRAIGAVAVGNLRDRRALGLLTPLLRDRDERVRRFALAMLARQSAEDLRHAAGARDLFEALIAQMGRERRLREASEQVLRRVSGLQEERSRTGWVRWLESSADATFVERVPVEPQLTGITPEEIARFRAEERGDGGVTGTVERNARFGTTLDELRKNGLQIVVCLDVTSSMRSSLERAKQEIETLFAILADLIGRFRVGLVTYRDEISQVVRMTRSSGTYLAGLLEEQAQGGGDSPEAVELALAEALGMRWRKSSAARVIVIVGDAPPRARNQERFMELAREARDRSIVIDALFPARRVPQIEEAVALTRGRTARIASEHELLKSFLALCFGEELMAHAGDFIDIYLAIREESRRR